MNTKAKKTVLDPLLGKKILGVSLNADKDLVEFLTNDGIIPFRAFGDCCSVSYIHHINGIKVLLGQKVEGIIEREEHSFSREEGDEVVCYGWTLRTDKGYCDLEMRNDSNGYYGGDLKLFTGQDQYSSKESAEDVAELRSTLKEVKADF